MFVNLLEILSKNVTEKAYELLYIDNTNQNKNIEQLNNTYSELLNTVVTHLFNKSIPIKFKNFDFKIALFYSKKYDIKYIPTVNYYLEYNLFGKLLTNLLDNFKFNIPDNYIRIINLYISSNKQVFNWIENEIEKYCNLYVAVSILLDKRIDQTEYTYILQEFYLNKIDILILIFLFLQC